jgi:hypothetical protein
MPDMFLSAMVEIAIDKCMAGRGGRFFLSFLPWGGFSSLVYVFNKYPVTLGAG